MEQTVTAKLQIYPTDAMIACFKQTTHAYRDACNYVSNYVFETKNLTQPVIQKVVYGTLRERYGLRSQMAISVIRTVIARYKTILTNEKTWIKPEFKQPQLDLVWNRDYSLTRHGLFSVNTLAGRKQVAYASKAMQQYFDGTWSFGTAKLIHKHKKWFLHIPVTKDISEVTTNDISHIVGIDLGINFLATTYDSHGKTQFFNGRPIKQKRAAYKALRSELQHRQTPSARKRLKQIGQRENRWMADVNHQISKALVTNSPKNTLFVLEDLTGIRNATEKVKRKDRYVSVSWSFFDFRQKLEYKALLYGHAAIFVDPAYTSQACPKCGHIERSNRNKKTHNFKCCNCGYQSNDDRVAAMNLYHKGIQYQWSVTSA